MLYAVDMKRFALVFLLACSGAHFPSALFAQVPSPPVITNFSPAGARKGLSFAPYPAASNYTILSATNLLSPLAPDANFFQAPYNVTNVYTNVINGANVVATVIQTLYEW